MTKLSKKNKEKGDLQKEMQHLYHEITLPNLLINVLSGLKKKLQFLSVLGWFSASNILSWINVQSH